MKIQIIGFSGSGKSTLAKILAQHYNLPLLHLDTVQFYGDWQVRSRIEQNEKVLNFLKNNPEDWVIDGNYSHLARERFSQADLIIYLKFNRFLCYKRCLIRYLKHRGKIRDSLGCLEKFDWEFQKWILFSGRTISIKNKHRENFELGMGEKVLLKSPFALRKFLKTINIK
jgi:adenylate kinase family enzyme